MDSSLVDLVALGSFPRLGLRILGGMWLTGAHRTGLHVGLFAERRTVGIIRVPRVVAAVIGIGPLRRIWILGRAAERVMWVRML